MEARYIVIKLYRFHNLPVEMWWQSEMCPSVWQSSQKGTPAERSLGTFWCIDPVSTTKKMSHYRNTNIRSIPKIPWMSKVHRLKGIHSKLYIIAIFILKYLERFNSKKKAPVHYGVLTWSVLHTAVPCPPSPRDSCLMDDLITSKL